MRRYQLILVALSTILLTFLGWAGAGEVPSGPQSGKDKETRVPGTFSPLVINGKWKDVNEKPVDRYHSFVVDFGLKPVVLVFARSYTDEATFAFLKKLDARIEKHKDQLLKGGVVFLCFDDKRDQKDIEAKELLANAKEKEEIVTQLKEKVQGLKNLVAAIDAPKGPPAWSLNEKADITIVLYDKFMVKKSIGLEKGDLEERADGLLKDIDVFIAALKKKPEPVKK